MQSTEKLEITQNLETSAKSRLVALRNKTDISNIWQVKLQLSLQLKSNKDSNWGKNEMQICFIG